MAKWTSKVSVKLQGLLAERRQKRTIIHGRQSPLTLNLLLLGSQVSFELNGENHCGGTLISKYIFKEYSSFLDALASLRSVLSLTTESQIFFRLLMFHLYVHFKCFFTNLLQIFFKCLISSVQELECLNPGLL